MYHKETWMEVSTYKSSLFFYRLNWEQTIQLSHMQSLSIQSHYLGFCLKTNDYMVYD